MGGEKNCNPRWRKAWHETISGSSGREDPAGEDGGGGHRAEQQGQDSWGEQVASVACSRKIPQRVTACRSKNFTEATVKSTGTDGGSSLQRPKLLPAWATCNFIWSKCLYSPSDNDTREMWNCGVDCKVQEYSSYSYIIWQGLRCCRKLSPMEVRFSKWFSSVKKCSEPFLTYIYGIQCDFMQKKVFENTLILIIAKFAI